MAWLAEELTDRALAPVEDDERDILRTLTLSNIAAAVGNRGAWAERGRMLPFDAGRAPGDAAFLFATQLHTRTQDDFYPRGRVHVGAIVLAAAMALAEDTDDRTLECLGAGYRVMCEIATVYSPEVQSRGLRPSGIFGPFGAAAAAAAALELSPEQTANAIALAAAASSGHNQAWISSSDEWLLEVGAAARAGVEAALFTQAGVTAAREAFEGAAGWATAFVADPNAERLAAGLAGPAVDAGVVAVKPYPVSGIAQVPTALACTLHEEIGTMRPRQVRVWVSPIELAYPGSANTGPFTSRSGALMSVAFCVACGLLDGTVRLDRLENPGSVELDKLLAVTTVAADPHLVENESRIEVDLDGGELQRTGRAADWLYPSWSDFAGDIDGLARRNEAAPDALEQARAELTRSAPQAFGLRNILDGDT